VTRCVCKGLCGTNHEFQCSKDGVDYQMNLCHPCQAGLNAKIEKERKQARRRELPKSPRMNESLDDLPLFGGLNR
jgi:hypothetical protein